MATKNKKEILVISDIHGRGVEFKYLVQKLMKRKDEFKFILLGDYVGYGSKNLETIQILRWVKENTDCIILKGNWEDMIYSYFRGTKKFNETLKSRGGINVVKELKSNEKLLNWYLDLIEAMRLYHVEVIDGKPYFFSHSGLNLNNMRINRYSCLDTIIEYQTEKDLIWNFNFFEEIKSFNDITKRFKVVAGHVPTCILNKNKNDHSVYLYGDSIIGVDLGASSTKGMLGFVNLSKKGSQPLTTKITTPTYRF